MPTDRFGIRVLEVEPTRVRLHVFVVYYEARLEDLLPEDRTFFFRALRDHADGASLGEAVSREEMFDEHFVDVNAPRYVKNVFCLETWSPPPDEREVLLDFYPCREGRWEDEEKLTQGVYDVIVTDPRWVEHLRPGMSWNTSASETRSVPTHTIELLSVTPVQPEQSIGHATMLGHDTDTIERLHQEERGVRQIHLRIHPDDPDRPTRGEGAFFLRVLDELWMLSAPEHPLQELYPSLWSLDFKTEEFPFAASVTWTDEHFIEVLMLVPEALVPPDLQPGLLFTSCAWVDTLHHQPVGLVPSPSWIPRLLSGERVELKPFTSGQEGATPGLLVFSPEGDHVALTSHTGELVVYDTGDWREALRITEPLSAPAASVEFVDEVIVLASRDGSERRAWSVTTRLELPAPARPPGRVRARDGSLSADYGDDHVVTVLDAKGEPTTTLVTEQNVVTVAAFSYDSKLLATGGMHNTVCLWDLQYRVLIRSFVAHQRVTGVTFSPDDRYVASTGNNELRIWRVGDGQILRALKSPDFLGPVAWSPDGRWIAVVHVHSDGDFAGTVVFHPTPSVTSHRT